MCKVGQPLKEYAIPILIIVIAVLVRYHELFFGADLFLYNDQFVNSDWSHGNGLGNGWRPEKGFGTSFFYADPGAWHPWSLISLWEKIAPSRRFAYHTMVIVLAIVSAIAVYFFLRRVSPGLGRSACLISPLILFTGSESSFILNRLPISSIAGISLLLILLYDFYNEPKLIHFFCATFIFWYVIFLGTFRNFGILVSMGFVFTIIYCIYHKSVWRKVFSKYFLIFFIGGLGTLLLGFWEFYSTFVEGISLGYLREKIYIRNWGIVPQIEAIGHYVLNFFQFYSIPINIQFLGLGWRPFYYSWNVSAMFPVVFIFFLFNRSSNFWEYSLKWLLAVFYITQALVIFPLFGSVLAFLSTKSDTIINFYGMSWSLFVFPLQMGLIGIFLCKIKDNDFEIEHLWGKKIQVALAWIFFIYYVSFTVFSFFSLFMPKALPSILSSIIERFLPEQMGRYPKEYIAFGSLSNLHALQNSMHWHSLLFYSLTALFMFSFTRRKYFALFRRDRVMMISGILLLSGILYSWTVVPLNKKPAVWDAIASELPEFKPTDRFYFMTNQYPLSQRLLNSKTLGEIKKWVESSLGGASRLEIEKGYIESPSLKLHGWKPFTQKDQGEFINHIFNGNGVNRLQSIRKLARGPIMSSELLDMGAVNYYYSTRELTNVPEYLSLYVKTRLISIYKNKNAWNYFYLAEKMAIKEEGNHLKNVKRGTAYVSENDFFQLPENAGSSSLQLKEFSYGRMVFDFQGDSEEFLVVADAWHPFWKASTGDKSLSVVKANEIFKGVKLPPGDYSVTLFFDTSPYFFGVYVSIVAWILFLTGLFLASKNKWSIPDFSKCEL